MNRALADAQRAGAEAAGGLIERTTSPNTRRTYYATALRQRRAWLDARPLDDASLTAYVGHLRATGRAPTTATMAVAAVRRAARDGGQQPPAGPLTRQALEGFRRGEAADTPARRGQPLGNSASPSFWLSTSRPWWDSSAWTTRGNFAAIEYE